VSIASLSALAAREVFVGTLGTIYALGGESDASDGLVAALRAAKNADGTPRYGLPTAVSLLIFFAIALQCMSTIVTVRRETGSWKIPALQFSFLFGLAYLLSFAGYRLALALLA
jgi:ferrous iron transport protein B